jgi:hypothetical protein
MRQCPTRGDPSQAREECTDCSVWERGSACVHCVSEPWRRGVLFVRSVAALACYGLLISHEEGAEGLQHTHRAHATERRSFRRSVHKVQWRVRALCEPWPRTSSARAALPASTFMRGWRHG